jgi:hypothetical protein
LAEKNCRVGIDVFTRILFAIRAIVSSAQPLRFRRYSNDIQPYEKHPDTLPSISALTLHSPDRCVCMEGDAPERGIYGTGAKPAFPSNSIRSKITSNVPFEFSINKGTRDEASFKNGWGM